MICALVTVGLSNATRAGVLAVNGARAAGTINAIFVCDAWLSEAAAVEIAMLAAEAKASALAEADVRTSDGLVATGTSTDAVVVAWRCGAPTRVRYAGSGTRIGVLVAGLMRAAIEAHLSETRS